MLTENDERTHFALSNINKFLSFFFVSSSCVVIALANTHKMIFPFICALYDKQNRISLSLKITEIYAD